MPDGIFENSALFMTAINDKECIDGHSFITVEVLKLHVCLWEGQAPDTVSSVKQQYDPMTKRSLKATKRMRFDSIGHTLSYYRNGADAESKSNVLLVPPLIPGIVL